MPDRLGQFERTPRILASPEHPVGCPMTHLEPGFRLGVFEIVELLGAGGMGEVYRAHDPRRRAMRSTDEPTTLTVWCGT